MVRRGAAPGAPASPMACREPFPTSPLRPRVPHRSRPSALRSGMRRRPGGRAWFRRSAFQRRMMPSPDGGCPQDRARRTSSRASTGSWPSPPGMRGPETTKGSMPTYSEPASIAACMTSAATSFSAAPARTAARWIPAFAGMTGKKSPPHAHGCEGRTHAGVVRPRRGAKRGRSRRRIGVFRASCTSPA